MIKKYNSEIVYISEIDKNAINAFCAIHGIEKEKNLGSITDINPSELAPINVLFGGSPCQSFSSAGKLEGSKWKCKNCHKSFDPLALDNVKDAICPQCGSTDIEKTESSLIVYWLNIFKSTRPKFAIFENVANLLNKRFLPSFNLFSEKVRSLGYDIYVQKMNSKDYGIPQNRDRVIFLAIRKDVNNGQFDFPDKIQNRKAINDLLDDKSSLFSDIADNVLIDNTISPYIRVNIEREIDDIIHSDKNIYRPTCTSGWNDNQIGIKYTPALRASNPITIVKQTLCTQNGIKHYIRRITPIEAYRFMGFDDEDYEKASQVCCKSAIYRQAGNSVVVDVVYLVLKQLFNTMPYLFEDIKVLSLFSGIGAFEKALKKVIDEANQDDE